MMLLRLLKRSIRVFQMKKDPIAYARSVGVVVGDEVWLVDLTDATFGSEPFLVSLGDHVAVASGVRFITHDGGFWVFRKDHPEIDIIGPIRVGNNVFIGLNTIILPGVTIGDDCVVGAGSVVTHDIPSGSVVAGVPARVICTKDEYWVKGQLKSTTEAKSLGHRQRRAYLADKYMG